MIISTLYLIIMIDLLFRVDSIEFPDDLVDIDCLLLQVVLQNRENLFKNGNVFEEFTLSMTKS